MQPSSSAWAKLTVTSAAYHGVTRARGRRFTGLLAIVLHTIHPGPVAVGAPHPTPRAATLAPAPPSQPAAHPVAAGVLAQGHDVGVKHLGALVLVKAVQQLVKRAHKAQRQYLRRAKRWGEAHTGGQPRRRAATPPCLRRCWWPETTLPTTLWLRSTPDILASPSPEGSRSCKPAWQASKLRLQAVLSGCAIIS